MSLAEILVIASHIARPHFSRDIWHQPPTFPFPSYTSLSRNHCITVFAAEMSVAHVDIDPDGDTVIILPHRMCYSPRFSDDMALVIRAIAA